MTLVKTAIRLADGCELLYFDEREGIDRNVPDSRDLAPASTSSQIRCYPLREEWVIVASHRQGRTHLPPADQCPLCPSRDGRQTEIPAADYDVVVFENRFPSLTSEPGEVPDGGAFRRQPGIGRCEVVCFTSDHGGALAGVPVCRIRTVVEVWADRTLQLGALEGVEQIFPFENRGEEIGSPCAHPHGQIYAYPFVAPRTARQLDVAREQRAATGGCCSCSIVAAEADGERVVGRAPGWLAFVPFAAGWRFEVHLYPTRHQAPARLASPRRLGAPKAWQRSSRGYSAASRRCSTSPCPTCSPAIRPRCGATATWPTCTWRLSRSAGRPPS